MRERTLYLQVLDYDRFSRNDPIGEVSIPLNKVELGQIKTFWKELKPCSDGSVRTEQIITRLWRLVLSQVKMQAPPKRAPITGPKTSPLRWFKLTFWELLHGSLLLIDYRYNTLRCDRPCDEIKG